MRHRWSANRFWTIVVAIVALTIDAAIAHASPQAQAAAPASELCCKPGDSGCTPKEYDGIRVALVIGVDDYNETSTTATDRLVNLHNAGNDAKLLTTALSSSSYVVRCILDADAKTLRRELSKLRDHLKPKQDDDTQELEKGSVIVHFSGHGFRDNGSDYILLSGKAGTLNEAKKAAVSVFEVSDTLSELTSFRIYLVFDSCRNRSDAGNGPAWANGFGSAKDYTQHRHTIVFGASRDQSAFDKNETIGAKTNGAFVFRAHKYFEFSGLTLRRVYDYLMSDPALEEIRQIPDVDAGEAPSMFPWSVQRERCAPDEAGIVDSIVACRKARQTACFKRTVCKALTELDAVATDDGTAASCSREKISATFPELKEKCPIVLGGVVEPAPVSDTSILSSAPAPSILTSASSGSIPDLHLNSILRSSNAKFSANKKITDLLAAADEPDFSALAPADTSFVAAHRKAVDAQKPFSDQATVKLDVAPGPIELNIRPSDKFGTTGILKPTGKPKVDCDDFPCTTDWAYVRVPTAKGPVDGWVPTSKVVLANPSASINVGFEKGDYVPTLQSQKSIQQLTSSVGKSAAIEITAAVKADADPDTKLLARARASHIRNILSNWADREKIEIRVLPTQRMPATEDITINLFNR